MGYSGVRGRERKHMGNKRGWDESRSPQWRYLLSKDSHEKREAEKREERAERAEGELLKRGLSKRKRASQERHKEKRSLTRTTTKAGKEIVYSASPGGEKGRYHNPEFEKSFHKLTTPEIFNNNNDDTK